MPYTDHLPGDPEDLAETQPVTCNRCGKPGLYWQEVWTNAGTKHKLFENGKQHICTTAGSAGNFDDLG